MDNSIIIALIAVGSATAASIPGILAYFNQRRMAASDATQILTDAAVTLIEPLRKQIIDQSARIAILEKENSDLKTQLGVLIRKNAYIEDLEVTKDKLEEHIAVLTGRIETLERTLKNVIDAFRKYIENPGIVGGDQMIELLKDIEVQTRL